LLNSWPQKLRKDHWSELSSHLPRNFQLKSNNFSNQTVFTANDSPFNIFLLLYALYCKSEGQFCFLQAVCEEAFESHSKEKKSWEKNQLNFQHHETDWKHNIVRIFLFRGVHDRCVFFCELKKKKWGKIKRIKSVKFQLLLLACFEEENICEVH
jgi:hypothetical protein